MSNALPPTLPTFYYMVRLLLKIVMMFNSFAEYGSIHKHDKTDEATRQQVLQHQYHNDESVNGNLTRSTVMETDDKWYDGLPTNSMLITQKDVARGFF